jgi:hypothetical protein
MFILINANEKWRKFAYTSYFKRLKTEKHLNFRKRCGINWQIGY